MFLSVDHGKQESREPYSVSQILDVLPFGRIAVSRSRSAAGCQRIKPAGGSTIATGVT